MYSPEGIGHAEIQTPQTSYELHSRLSFLTKARSVIGRIGLATALALGTGTGIAHEAITPDEAAAETGGYPHAALPCIYSPYNTIGKCPNYDWGTITKNQPGYSYNSSVWSSRSYGYRNCTDYVAWRVQQEFGVDIRNWGNATTWNNNAASRFTVDTTPEAGDIAVWEGRDNDSNNYPGHVAFVESVNGDGSVNVAQYNQAGMGEFSRQSNRRANSYIDINGTGRIWNGSNGGNSAPNPAPTPSGNIPYAAIAEGQEMYSSEGHVYTKVGGAAFHIKHKSQWNSGDTYNWGGNPIGPVPTAEVHDHEANYPFPGAHPPRNGTAIYGQDLVQQYYFLDGKAYAIKPSELDDLGVRDKALMVPKTKLNDFVYRYPQLDLPNGSLYRLAGTPRVNQLIETSGGGLSYYVNNETALNCLMLTQNLPVQVIPQAARNDVNGFLGTTEIDKPTACSFPSGWILFGPGGQEQWRIEGDNSQQPYYRRRYYSPLDTYLNTSGNPIYKTLGSTAALNNIAEGPAMDAPHGIFFHNTGNGDVFKVENGVFRRVPWPDMLACLGNPSIVNVPPQAIGAIPQGPMMSCGYDNRVLTAPDGKAFYVKDGKRHYIPNPAVRDCISSRRGAGRTINVSQAAIESFVTGTTAYCNYEQEPGLNFVQENGDPTVWLVVAGGVKRHVGRNCVSDPYTTQHKKFHIWSVPQGETAGHTQGADFWGDPTICGQLPG